MFLTDYDLIRITGQPTVGKFAYAIYTGTGILSAEDLLEHQGALQEQWAYAAKDRTRILVLHPWLISWEEPGLAKDAAMFDSYSETLIRYLSTVSGVNVRVVGDSGVVWKDRDADPLIARSVQLVNKPLLQDFVQLVWDTIEDIKQKKEEAQRLTWQALKDAAWKISRQQMGEEELSKYQQRLHCPRQAMERIFEAFLGS